MSTFEHKDTAGRVETGLLHAGEQSLRRRAYRAPEAVRLEAAETRGGATGEPENTFDAS